MATAPLPFRSAMAHRPVIRALRRRRHLRASLVQLVYVVASFALALVLARIGVGPTIPATTAVPMLFALAGGLVGFIGIVYSLLFVVVQWASSTFSPRLNLFRDRPLVWHSFAFFVGTIVYCLTSGLALGDQTQVSIAVPSLAGLAILVSLALFQALQRQAFASIQLAPTLDAIAANGRLVLGTLYAADYQGEVQLGLELPPTQLEVRWTERPRVLQQIDLPALIRLADRTDVVVVLLTAVGAQLVEHDVVVRIHGLGAGPSETQVLRTLVPGPERTFDQDPTLAFRLLADIALRALSPAINDPTTAVQALDTIDGLLRPLCTRNFDVGRVTGAHDDVRVVVPLPRWQDLIALISDEIILAARESPAVLQRLDGLLTGVLELTPPARQPAVRDRLASIQRFHTALTAPLRPDEHIDTAS
jgi:uncharacterized membrane protein